MSLASDCLKHPVKATFVFLFCAIVWTCVYTKLFLDWMTGK